jgi:hypothetical protein
MLSIMDLLKEVLDMARKQYTAEQIIGKLREVEFFFVAGQDAGTGDPGDWRDGQCG